MLALPIAPAIEQDAPMNGLDVEAIQEADTHSPRRGTRWRSAAPKGGSRPRNTANGLSPFIGQAPSGTARRRRQAAFSCSGYRFQAKPSRLACSVEALLRLSELESGEGYDSANPSDAVGDTSSGG